MEQPREPIFYPDEISVSIKELKKNETVLDHGTVNKGDLKEIMDKFNDNKQNFICTEALKIFCETQSDEIALRALELLGTVAQPF